MRIHRQGRAASIARIDSVVRGGEVVSPEQLRRFPVLCDLLLAVAILVHAVLGICSALHAFGLSRRTEHAVGIIPRAFAIVAAGYVFGLTAVVLDG